MPFMQSQNNLNKVKKVTARASSSLDKNYNNKENGDNESNRPKTASGFRKPDDETTGDYKDTTLNNQSFRSSLRKSYNNQTIQNINFEKKRTNHKQTASLDNV